MSNLSELLPAGGGVNNTDFTADGAIAINKPVILNSNGTVSEVALTDVAQSVPASGASFANWWDDSKNQRDWSSYGAAKWRNRYDISVSPADSNKAVVVAMTEGSVQCTVCVLTRDGDTITAGDHVNVLSGWVSYPYDNRYDEVYGGPKIACGAVENQFIVIYNKSSVYGRTGTWCRVGTINGSTCSLGTETVVQNAGNSNDNAQEHPFIAADPNADNKYVVGWVDNSYPYAKVATVSGTGVSFGSAVQYNGASKGSCRVDCAFEPTGSPTARKLAFTVGSYNTRSPEVVMTTYSGTTMGSHSNATYVNHGGSSHPATEQGGEPRISFDASNGNMVLSYRSEGAYGQSGGTTGYGVVRVLESNGTQNTKVVVSSEQLGPYHNVQVTDIAGDPNNTGKFCVSYSTQSDDTIHFRSFYTSGNSGSITCTLSSEIDVVSETSGSGTSPYVSSVPQSQLEYWGSDDGKIVFIYTGKAGQHDEEWVGVGQAAGTQTTNMTSANLIGISSAAISDNASGTINTWGSISEDHSGLTIDSDYYAQEGGTLSTSSTSPAQLMGKAINATTINMKDYTG